MLEDPSQGALFLAVPHGTRGFYFPGEVPPRLPYRRSTAEEMADAAVGKRALPPIAQALRGEELDTWQQLVRDGIYREPSANKYGEMLMTLAPLQRVFVYKTRNSSRMKDLVAVSHDAAALRPCLVLCRLDDSLV